jgi:adenine phosphoribosyltransferase
MKLEDYLPGILDFPKPGIVFRDIAPLLADADAFAFTIETLGKLSAGYSFDYILGIESRGFIFASALANHLHKGFVMVRKPNKLPPDIHQESYGLEYGSDTLEISKHILRPGASVLIVDDVLATGGTIAAAARLAQKTGARVVAAVCVLEIAGLNGSQVLDQAGIANQCAVTL